MSSEKARNEAIRWLQTAHGDIKTARILLSNERYAHACFHAHQAGEKCLKAFWYLYAGDPWGHSIQKLISDLKEFNIDLYHTVEELIPLGSKLDKLYIPTRCPNGLPDLTPDDSFMPEDAEAAVKSAEKIVKHIQDIIL
jgi:HEPN domain-containing protein